MMERGEKRVMEREIKGGRGREKGSQREAK